MKNSVGSRRAYVLPLNLPLAGGALLRYASAEVLDVGRRGGEHRLVLSGAADGAAELELLGAATRATLDGRRLPVERRGRRSRVRFATTGRPQVLRLR